MNKYKTFEARFAAAIVDGVIFIPLGFLNNILADLLSGFLGILILWTIVYILSYQFYSIFMHGKHGQTIGKRMMSVKIVTYPEELPITYRHAFIRDLPYTILLLIDIILTVALLINPELNFNETIISLSGIFGYAAILWFLVEIVSMFFNDKRRAVHDLIAKTVVIKI